MLGVGYTPLHKHLTTLLIQYPSSASTMVEH